MVFTVTIWHDRAAITVPRSDVDRQFGFLERMSSDNIQSVRDAVEARLHSWPDKAMARHALAGRRNIAAMGVLDIAFIVRCPFSRHQINQFQMEQSDDEFEHV